MKKKQQSKNQKRSRIWQIAILSLVLVGCVSEANTKFELDQSDPASVLEAVFAVAKGNAPAELLADLCDPQAENDADTRRICDYATGFDPEGEFPMFFASGKVNGQSEIVEDQANVPFLYGPNAENQESMALIRREGRWFLYQF